MTNQSTIDKLTEMRLTAMTDAFRSQINDPKFKEVPFEDRFGILVDIEHSSRKANRLKRLIHNAGFDQPDASIMDINYTSGRKHNKELINRLATCEYISEHRNLFITGATGCGKTYMACAFGMEACKQYYNTRYVRLPDLLIDLEMARTDGTYRKVMAKYANPLVLILDEWLLLKPTEVEQKDIFELLHRRRKKSSTIFCSQYGFEEWYDQLGGDASPLADAIIDRIAHLKMVYAAPDEAAALEELESFGEKWNSKYPKIYKSWSERWATLSTYFKYPNEVRKLIYTTNAIEGFNRQLRKVTKSRTVFPSDDSLLKMLYLATMDITKKWTGRRRDWSRIRAQLEIYFEEQLEKAEF